jgi:5-methyltetrahydrofolate--homocysteine methyltransferase
MPDILTRLGRDVLVIDGAFGTMLQRAGIPPEQCPEQLNLTGPEIVSDIHRGYVLAGADCVTTNSFGGSRPKLDEYGLGDQVAELNRAAVRVARASGAQHVLADVGPTGLVIEPLGTVSFDFAFEVFAEQVSALAAEEPDAIIVETMTDIAEARCAVLAARSVCDLPVIASVTFGQGGVMDISGTDPVTAAIVLEAAGASAVGMNCGLGPEQMLPLVEAMAAATALPIIVQPNAGLPRLEDGRTVFPGTADEMGTYAARFVAAGASLVGSCCGSSPSFTGTIVDFAKELPVVRGRSGLPGVVLSGPRRTLRIGAGAPIAVIGERINPTGKSALADSLRTGSMSVVRQYAAEQAHAGASALDVNVGAAGVDATTVLRAAALALSGASDLPLVLDNTDAAALEPALRAYPGRALINSVNGSEESLDTILPLARRYGAAVVALALDDDGIPAMPPAASRSSSASARARTQPACATATCSSTRS